MAAQAALIRAFISRVLYPPPTLISQRIALRNVPWVVAACGLFAAAVAQAHPLSQGALSVTLHPDGIRVQARVTVEEMTVTNRATSADSADPFAAMNSASFEQHAAYLAAHLHILADGQPLSGGIVHVQPPDNPEPSSTDRATYEFLYPFLRKNLHPTHIEIQDDVLKDGNFLPGARWEATYVVTFQLPGAAPSSPHLLTSSTPLTFSCSVISSSSTEAHGVAGDRLHPILQTLHAYFWHGIHHIFNKTDPGYDHLLFVAALALGATRFWELFKLVTAFTLAHTITLTLAALNWVHVSEHVVEPLIALSIVCVAVENLIWPGRAHSRLRLAAAFFFGLFHGLGFAGALLEAMQGMSGATVLPAILAFSIGVEAAHQMVVVPLFFLLKFVRQTREDPIEQQRFAQVTQRVGSAAVSLAGLFYLFVALRFSFAS